MRLVCASANPDKVAEIQAILGDSIELAPRPTDVPDVVEDADTLLGHAGLEVDALGGAPGVYSARYAGDGCTYADNVAKLLAELSDRTDRSARFRTVAIVVWPDGSETAIEGECRGRIATAPTGDSGFGYDPIFVPDDGDGRTFAELSADEKHAVSHRGRAFRALLDALLSGAG